jgi:hypothetical protein
VKAGRGALTGQGGGLYCQNPGPCGDKALHCCNGNCATSAEESSTSDVGA